MRSIQWEKFRLFLSGGGGECICRKPPSIPQEKRAPLNKTRLGSRRSDAGSLLSFPTPSLLQQSLKGGLAGGITSHVFSQGNPEPSWVTTNLGTEIPAASTHHLHPLPSQPVALLATNHHSRKDQREPEEGDKGYVQSTALS